jgi:hypothetical protein
MKRQPVQAEEMPTFIGIDYHKAYSIYSMLDAQGESLGQGRIDHAQSGGFPRADGAMAGMPRGL